MAGKPAPPQSVKPAKGGFSIVTLLLIVLAVAAASGGASWFVFGRKATAANAETADAHGDPHAAAGDGRGDAHADGHGGAKPGQAQYLALDPAFVVNTADDETQHYLQADVQVMARNADALEAVKTHMPHIRNNLLLLFAQQKTTDVRDRAGRERLQGEALKEVQSVLQAETGKPGVEALYFTSFVTQ